MYTQALDSQGKEPAADTGALTRPRFQAQVETTKEQIEPKDWMPDATGRP